MNVSKLIRKLKVLARVSLAQREIERRLSVVEPRSLEHIGRKVVISLTSYSKRFSTLHWTLKSLLFQTVKPHAVVLWVDAADYDRVPYQVAELAQFGLQVRVAPNMRSYTKIIPALVDFPDCLIVTADDDVYYWGTWLEELVRGHAETGNPIVCHRAHEVLFTNGGVQPYASWRHCLRARQASPLVFPTGVSGVLYDPSAFHEDVAKRELFESLCPSSDDIWLYWMHRLKGSTPLTLGMSHRVLEWPGSQAQQLQALNILGRGNDEAISAMVSRYGFPA